MLIAVILTVNLDYLTVILTTLKPLTTLQKRAIRTITF